MEEGMVSEPPVKFVEHRTSVLLKDIESKQRELDTLKIVLEQMKSHNSDLANELKVSQNLGDIFESAYVVMFI